MPNLLEAPGDGVTTKLTARPGGVWVSRPGARHARLAVNGHDSSKAGRGGSAGMRSGTAMRRRPTGEATITVYHRRVFPQLKTGVVGLAGLEPAGSSLSGIEGSALCGPAFSQVAGERQGRRDAFLATSF